MSPTSQPETDTPSNEGPTFNGRVLVLDAEKYQSYLENMDLSASQKTELLQALWSIMSTFVDLGFGTDSAQRVLPDSQR